MAQLFSRSSNAIARWSLISIAACFFLFWGVGYAVYRSPYTTDVAVPRAQPVMFSHEHHTAGLGIDCRYCHISVEDSAFAGMPPTHTCMTCHSQVWTEAPILEPVRQSLAKERPLQWTRVHDLPDYVFFNHSIHVQKGIGCSTCHGRVDRMPLMEKAHSLYMRWCLECHQEPARYIRPKEQVFDMTWEPPLDQATRGVRLAEQFHVNTAQLRDCSICHR